MTPSSALAAEFPLSLEPRASHPVRGSPSLGLVRLGGLYLKFGGQRRWLAPPGPRSQPQLHSRAPTVSVSPRSMAELMAGASLLALRSISSMTPCTSGPDRLWNSIAAGPGTRLPRGRACPRLSCLALPALTGPVHRHRGPGPARARLRPQAGLRAPGARGPGRLPPRCGGSYIAGRLGGGAEARVTRAGGEVGAGDQGRGRRPLWALSRRRHRSLGSGAQGANQGRKLCPRRRWLKSRFTQEQLGCPRRLRCLDVSSPRGVFPTKGELE